jgi:alanyl-tRNA synthetase
MTSAEIRERYLKFFEKRGHKIIPSASLIPENDPSVLFTTAGMHPLVPYLLGEKHPLGKRLTDVQKCVRTGDIDEVGDYSHHTFFEMLGNWSLGEYFKKEAIEWSFEFLTSKREGLGLDKNRLAVSVFQGDDSSPLDEEAFKIWKELGIDEKKIAKLPKKNNWWGPAGQTGPCGPDTEMFYWVGSVDSIPKTFNDDNPLWLEIWNDVFMQYNKNIDSTFEKLSQRNVDTGMGLERVLAVVNGFDDNYQTELFWPIIEKIEKLSSKKYLENLKPVRIIADHLKASVFILGDEKGITPANTGQGYVLRRLIRRAVKYGHQLNMKSFTSEVAEIIISIYKSAYPEILSNKKFVLDNLVQEEERFEKTLEKGLKEFEKGIDPFILFTTYGFPFELTQELAKEKGLIIDENKFSEDLKKHQELSRTSSAGMFKGGLADAGIESKKYHTATHLLLAALRNVLKAEIVQKGSNITAERLRFDFNWPEKMTSEQIKAVEDLVNQKIQEKLVVEMIELPKEEAKKIVTTLSFDLSKYGDIVKVYKIGNFSAEFCGGPHVANTSELGHFKIVKEEACASDIRRIKAVLI